MVPEINIIDENPPIFDLEWMDQCADKVNKSMMILAFDNSKMVQVTFTGPGIDELLAEVNKQLSYKIRGEFNNKFRQQAMFVVKGKLKYYFKGH